MRNDNSYSVYLDLGGGLDTFEYRKIYELYHHTFR
jgi:hypothetical protein